MNYRHLWFDHVAKTRKKLSTKKKPCTHREAMAKASISWPKVKARLVRKRKRETKTVKSSSDKSILPEAESPPVC